MDTISQSFNNMLKNLENSCNMPEYDLFDSDSFDQEEQECVSKALKDFDVKINSIGELIKGLKFYNLSELSTYNNSIDTYQIFQENANEKDYVDIKIKSGNEIIPENDSVINIKFAFKFLFDSNYSYQISDTSLMNDLKKLKMKKN